MVAVLGVMAIAFAASATAAGAAPSRHDIQVRSAHKSRFVSKEAARSYKLLLSGEVRRLDKEFVDIFNQYAQMLKDLALDVQQTEANPDPTAQVHLQADEEDAQAQADQGFDGVFQTGEMYRKYVKGGFYETCKDYFLHPVDKLRLLHLCTQDAAAVKGLETAAAGVSTGFKALETGDFALASYSAQQAANTAEPFDSKIKEALKGLSELED